MTSGFDRVEVAIEMVAPLDGIPIALLEAGRLLIPEGGWPAFQLVHEVKLGVGVTVITDAECCEPGRAYLPGGSIVEVAGYPRDVLRCTQRGMSNGARPRGPIVQGVEVLGAEPERGTAIARQDDRYRHAELEEIRTIVRMNLDYLDMRLPSRLSLPLYGFVNGGGAAVADLHANFARVGIVAGETPVMLVFKDTRLVYLSFGEEPVVNRLPSGTRLFLPSEEKRLGPG